jgi:peptide/nickel transport system substrate-binding protein
MRLFDWRWFAVSSVLATVLTVQAETRPQYGGTLHVATRTTLTSLDPADRSQPDSFARRSITLLIFETLVAVDDSGRLHPGLATSWQASPGNQRWQFLLRRAVKFNDGTPLIAAIAAASLRMANPTWNVMTDGDSVTIECENADSEVPAELAQARNAIAKRDTGNRPTGTGPFQVIDWQPGKKLTLAAQENYWKGRPFLDTIEIEMGRSYRDQLTALELGKADLVEIAPEQIHRVGLEGRQVVSSAPMELIALLFARDPQTPEEKSLREALAWSVERGSIRSVLLQGAGQPAAAVLPNWMSGYGFVFPTDADLAKARHAREQFRTIPTWTVGYDSSDQLARLMAERIALNAKDAGLSLQPMSAATTDLRLTRIPLASPDGWISLSDVSTGRALAVPKSKDGWVEDLYSAEKAILASDGIIPLFHLPTAYSASAALKDWNLGSDGVLSLADAWLEGKP